MTQPTGPTQPAVTQPTGPTQPAVTQPTGPSTPVITKPVQPVQPVEINSVGFSQQAYQTTENAGSVNIIVNRTGTFGEVRVELLSSDDSAIAGIDYQPVVQSLFWGSGDEIDIHIPVKIIDNSQIDGDKNLILSLGNADNAKLRLDTAILTIVDDEAKAQVVVQPDPIEPGSTEITEEPSGVVSPTPSVPINEIPQVNSPPIVHDCLKSGGLQFVCNAGNKVITFHEVAENAHLSKGILESHLSNKGLISNLTITPKGSVKGGKVSGYTQNEGLIEDIEFVGASLTGKNAEGEIVGTLGGKIILSSEIGGVVEDVWLAPNTHIVGREIRKLGSKTTRQRLGGIIRGDRSKPAILERVHIEAFSEVSNVIVEENVTYGEGVTFTDVEFRTPVVREVSLSGHIKGSRFKENYTQLESVTIRSESVISNVVIGEHVVFEDEVRLGENVSFSVHERYMETHHIEALPDLTGLAAIDKFGYGISTLAKLQGGTRLGGIKGSNGESYRRQKTFKGHEREKVEVFGNVLTDVRHVGQKADILVVAAYTPPGALSPTFYRLNQEGRPLIWEGAMSSLIPFRANVSLAPVMPVQIWNKPLDILGKVQVYLGYRLKGSGELVYSQAEVIEMVFTEE